MVVDGVRGAGGLLERDAELRLIGGLVERAGAGEGGLVVVQGHAGVGKTELLRAAGELGEAAGLRVLRGRGSELDRAFAFGVVRQLLEREVADAPELLTGGAEPGADQELLDALMVAPAARVLRPAPLSADATTTVVRGVLPDAVDAFSAACHRATGGNPFLLGELLAELAADGVRGAAGDAPGVLEFGPERVGRAIRRRLRLLPAEATAVARAVAILGPGTALDEAAGLAGCDAETAARAADALVGIHVL